MSDDRDAALKEILGEQLLRLSKANASLRYAFDRASNIGIKPTYPDDELTVFDALSSRFVRSSDVLMVSVWGTLDRLEREERGSFLDRIYRAEKRGIISSAKDFKDVRDLRNKIVHEYVVTRVEAVFAEVLRLAPLVLEAEQSALKYSQSHFL